MPATVTDVAEFYLVRRPFNALGTDLEPGEVVTVDGWANVQPLINTRRLQPAPHDIIDKSVTCECKRVWESERYAQEHPCPKREVKSTRESEPQRDRTSPVKKKEIA